MKNDIRIENMHGGAIQQGTTCSRQSVRGQVVMSGADHDLRDFIVQAKAALQIVPEPRRTELQPVIEALEIEATQQSPDHDKVSGLLQSIRTICEGVVSNVAAAGIVAIVTKLLTV